MTDRYSYDAFGNLIGVAGSTENNYLFAGEQFDGGLGDYYLRARYYDTDTGRFTRRDSYEGRLLDPMSQHKYLYANADPVNNIDPTGYNTLSISESLDIIATVTALASLYYLSSTVQLESLKHPGGFGDGDQPSFPNHTGHDNLLAGLLNRLERFGEVVWFITTEKGNREAELLKRK